MAAYSLTPLFEVGLCADADYLVKVPAGANIQYTLVKKDGTVLSISRDAQTGRAVYGSAPAGSTGPCERAWPHPPDNPSFLSYWPEQDSAGTGNQTGFVIALIKP